MPRSRKSLKRFAVLYKELERLEGADAAERIMNILAQTLGGERLTIPDMVVMYREGRNARVRESSAEGMSRTVLARKFAIDESTVDRIRQQLPLFGGGGEQ